VSAPAPDLDAVRPFAVPLGAAGPGERRAVVAIGNFDGVHRGHQAVLSQARRLADEAGAAAFALTFEPHPRTLFRPDQPVFRLTPPAAKARVLSALGLDGMIVAGFDRAFSERTADGFVDDVLIAGLGVRHVVIGYDFHFGKARAGTPAFLAEAGARHGFGVTVVSPWKDETGGAVSATRVRDALSHGDVPAANALLGWRWQVDGEVRHGDKRGRLLGYPTANLRLPDDCAAAFGIYAVRVRVGGTLYDGVASYGRRPTFDDGAPLFEVNLFDFSGDLYGQTLVVTLVERLRGEEKFASAEALIAQMDRDAAKARAVLSAMTPLSDLDAVLSF
jgi:riboflavin kinase/FMN adenylyltransferase